MPGASAVFMLLWCVCCYINLSSAQSLLTVSRSFGWVVLMKKFAPFALRVGIGGLFVAAGIAKLLNPSMVTGLLGSLGFPAPGFWAWLLILVELLGGAAVLLGFYVRWAAVPLGVVLLVAAVTNPGGELMLALTNLALLAGVVSLWLSGPGRPALSKK